MSRNTLYSLIKVLTRQEQEEAVSYLGSSVSGAKKHHVSCFSALKEEAAGKHDSNGMSNEKLYARIFGQTPFNGQKLRRIKSETCRLVEDFLVLTELKSRSAYRSELLASALANRKDHSLFEKTVAKRIDKLNAREERGKTYHHELAALYKYLYYHPAAEPLDKNNDLLQRHIEHLENHFILDYLESGAESFLKRGIINSEEQLVLLDAVHEVAERRTNSSPSIKIFLLLFRLYADNVSTAHWSSIKKEVFSSLKYLGYREKQIALKLLAQKVNSSAQMDKAERNTLLFELYKRSVESGFSKLPNSIIDPSHFLNIVTVAMKAGKFKWANRFLKQKSRYLPKDEKTIVEYISLGIIYFHQGSARKKGIYFEKALTYLGFVPVRCHEKYNLRKRSLLLRIYYEQDTEGGEFEELNTEIRRFEEYLRGNTGLSKKKKAGYFLFFKKLKTLCKIHHSLNRSSELVDLYIKELQQGEKFSFREWMIEKAEELK